MAMKSKFSLASLYVTIATFASITNLAIQAMVSSQLSNVYAMEISMIVATAIVFPFKFLIEKKYIFFSRTRSARKNAQSFIAYLVVSVFTVMIFWLIEYLTYLVFRTPQSIYAGALCGLALSFYTKYQMDKRYVFNSTE